MLISLGLFLCSDLERVDEMAEAWFGDVEAVVGPKVSFGEVEGRTEGRTEGRAGRAEGQRVQLVGVLVRCTCRSHLLEGANTPAAG